MNEWNKYRDSESSVSLPIDHLFSAAHRGPLFPLSDDFFAVYEIHVYIMN